MPGMYDELLGKAGSLPGATPPFAPPTAPQKPGFSFGGVLDGIGKGLLQLRRISPNYQQEQMDKAAISKILEEQGDPLAARAAGVDIQRGVDLWDRGVDNKRQQSVADSTIRENNDQYETLTHQRAGALIGAATKDTFPAMRKRYYDYYASRGVQPYIELPDTFDEATQIMVQRANMTPEQQARADAQAEYRDDLLEYRKSTEIGRNERAELAEGGRNSRAAVSEGGKNARADAAERGRKARADQADRTKRDLADKKRGRNGKPDVQFDIVNGVRRVKQT